MSDLQRQLVHALTASRASVFMTAAEIEQTAFEVAVVLEGQRSVPAEPEKPRRGSR